MTVWTFKVWPTVFILDVDFLTEVQIAPTARTSDARVLLHHREEIRGNRIVCSNIHVGGITPVHLPRFLRTTNDGEFKLAGPFQQMLLPHTEHAYRANDQGLFHLSQTKKKTKRHERHHRLAGAHLIGK